MPPLLGRAQVLLSMHITVPAGFRHPTCRGLGGSAPPRTPPSAPYPDSISHPKTRTVPSTTLSQHSSEGSLGAVHLFVGFSPSNRLSAALCLSLSSPPPSQV